MQEEKLTFGQKISQKIKNINLKIFIRTLTVIVVIVLIILSSLGFGINPEKLDFYDWLSNTTFMVFISVFGILMGESIGNDKFKSSVNGLFQKALVDYDYVIQSIEPIIQYFSDFLIWFKQKELERIKIELLIDNGIKKAKDIVKFITIEQLDELKKHPIKLSNQVIIDTMKEEEVEFIKNVLYKTKINSNSSSYYLNALENATKLSELEIGYKIDKEKTRYKNVQRITKIGISIMFSLAWAMMTRQDFANDSQRVQALFNLISRITTLVTCLFSGMLTANIEVKKEADKIENKVSTLKKFKLYYDNKDFVPEDYDKQANIAYEKYCTNIKKGENDTNGQSKNNNS